MIKVTMNLTDSDTKAATFLLDRLSLRNKAQVVSFALTLAVFIVRTLLQDPKKQLFVRNADGTLDGVLIPELESVRNDLIAAAG